MIQERASTRSMSGYLVLINPACPKDADALLLKLDSGLADETDPDSRLLCHVLLALVTTALEAPQERVYR